MEVVKLSNKRMRCHFQATKPNQPCQCQDQIKRLPIICRVLAKQVNSLLRKDSSLLVHHPIHSLNLLLILVLHSSQTNLPTTSSNPKKMETSETNQSCEKVWIFSTNAADTSCFQAIYLHYTHIKYHN